LQKKKSRHRRGIEEALKQRFTKVIEKDTRVTGPLLRLKAEELANEIGKNDFVHICITQVCRKYYNIFQKSTFSNNMTKLRLRK